MKNCNTTQETTQETTQVKRLLVVIGNETLSAQELMARFNLKNRRNFGKTYLEPALKAKLIEMTIPDKPNSKLQKYRRCNFVNNIVDCESKCTFVRLNAPIPIENLVLLITPHNFFLCLCNPNLRLRLNAPKEVHLLLQITSFHQ